MNSYPAQAACLSVGLLARVSIVRPSGALSMHPRYGERKCVRRASTTLAEQTSIDRARHDRYGRGE